MHLLDDYNSKMEREGKDEQVISYTDMVGTLMSSVTDIVDIISYVLIAFVAISLVVSSIMIGVITYISVLERRKEIGILRAIGASKGNISQVFGNLYHRSVCRSDRYRSDTVTSDSGQCPDSQTGRYHCCQCIPAGDSGTYPDRVERISYVYRWTDSVEESGKE